MGKYSRQIFILPCGSGKSRISSSIALLLLTLTPTVKRIHYVYANEILKKKDVEDFDDLFTLLNANHKIQRHCDIDFSPSSNSIVILDDCDDLVLSNPYAFMKFSKRTTCIVLSATATKSYTGGIEGNVLKKLEFKVFEDLL